MRDLVDNTVIICSNENVDPMWIHIGDSITTVYVQTINKEEEQIRKSTVSF